MHKEVYGHGKGRVKSIPIGKRGPQKVGKENSHNLATYHLVQNYASRQTKVSIGNWSIGYQKYRQGQSFLYLCLSTLWASRRLTGRVIKHTEVKGPSTLAKRR